MGHDETTEVERTVERASEARTEHARLRARLRVAEADRAAAGSALRDAMELRVREAADVEALESWSPTRIWAGLRGRREVDLSREEAELQAAEYAVASATARHQAAAAAVEQVESGLRALGDTDAQWEHALAAKEELLVATEAGPAGELVELAERRGELVAEAHELDEADAAGRAAYECLDQAVELLEKARSWSSWDTFGGGGMITDAIKYDRMDKASAVLREADARLRRLRVELADVDLSGVPDVAVGQLLQTFDVWFDNIFSDWSVRSRIIEALQAATRARADVQQVAGVLRGRREEVESERVRLEERRGEILTDR